MSSLTYRRDIDGLRAFAVLPVLFAHAGLPGFSGGFVGVDVFFVISGFLITGILMREIGESRFSLASFYERRARRILPALFAVVIACIGTGWFVLPPEPFKELAQSVLAAMLFVSNFWFWQSTGDYFGADAEWQPLLHTWSLSVEEQFYLGFPLLLCLLAARGRRSLLFGVGCLSFLSLLFSIWATKAQPLANYFFSPTRVWELGVGALIALGALPAARQRWQAELAAASGLLMILAAVLLYDSATPFPGLAALLPCVGAAALIWAGGQGATLTGRMIAWSPFVFVGLISYSLYLWHWPVLVLFRLLHGTAELPLLLAVQAIVLSLLLAWLSWRFVEAPFRLPFPVGMSRRNLVRTCGAMATLIVAVSLAINVNKGVPSRLPDDLFASYRDAIERAPEERRCMGRLPADGLCEFGTASGENNSPDYLLWGDSHAGAFLPGYQLWLQDRGHRGVAAVKSACAPLLGVVRVEMGPAQDCDSFNAQVIEMLESREDIGTVILVARWALVVEGSRSPGESGPPAVMGLAGDAASVSANAAMDQDRGNAELVAKGLAETVSRIRATGREVLIVESTPELAFSVPMAIVSAEFAGAQLQAAPTREEVEARNQRTNAIFDVLVEEFQAQRESLVPDLCRPRCQIQADGTPLYRDDDHLSTFGSEQLVPVLLDRLPSG
ncbi:O-acetyltransferase OatA [Microbulbifer aggregans]|uniref:O-acetyltransferase OatA n=1 Tax=Microbulbifer aggregans TaxID=1769779 RepID=A0A1C9W2Y7_9GAMM|nr:acyltransferase family protein [Microbulbifer aggregans]AOS95504.1 O-acetyltransferase OatA [Microbulbifer aggregans]